MSYYERRLPHWQPEDAAIFLTWRLHGSLYRKPDVITTTGKAFVTMDRELAKADTGPRWLEDERVASCVVETLHYADRELKLYELLVWVLMCNHVHILIRPNATVSNITKSVKGFSARQANAILGRAGEPFWNSESFDHWVRNADELERIADYIENNPVAAGLVKRPEDWRWSSAFVERAFGARQAWRPTTHYNFNRK